MTRDEYVRQAAERLAGLRGPTVAGEIDIPDEVVRVAGREATVADRTWPRNVHAVAFNALTRALAESGSPVLFTRRQRATDAVLAALDEIGALTYEPFVASAGERDVIDMGFLSLPAEIQAEAEAAAAVAPAEPPRPAGWCRWHEMADCHGDTPFCREARAELDGGGDE